MADFGLLWACLLVDILLYWIIAIAALMYFVDQDQRMVNQHCGIVVPFSILAKPAPKLRAPLAVFVLILLLGSIDFAPVGMDEVVCDSLIRHMPNVAWQGSVHPILFMPKFANKPVSSYCWGCC